MMMDNMMIEYKENKRKLIHIVIACGEFCRLQKRRWIALYNRIILKKDVSVSSYCSVTLGQGTIFFL